MSFNAAVDDDTRWVLKFNPQAATVGNKVRERKADLPPGAEGWKWGQATKCIVIRHPAGAVSVSSTPRPAAE